MSSSSDPYLQPQEVQIFTAPLWDWGSAVPSCMGLRSPPGWGGMMGQLPLEGNLQWCVKCCAPMSQMNKILREPRTKPGRVSYGGTASNLRGGSVLTQNTFLLMFCWCEQTLATSSSHTDYPPSTSSSAAIASMWWEREEPRLCSFYFSCWVVLQLELVRKKWSGRCSSFLAR